MTTGHTYPNTSLDMTELELWDELSPGYLSASKSEELFVQQVKRIKWMVINTYSLTYLFNQTESCY